MGTVSNSPETRKVEADIYSPLIYHCRRNMTTSNPDETSHLIPNIFHETSQAEERIDLKVDANKQRPQLIFDYLKFPVLVYGVVAAVYVGHIKGQWNLFSFHPVAMIVAFFICVVYAVMHKRIGGTHHTRMHGAFMTLCLIASLIGWYAIFTYKNLKGKPHLHSNHGKFGAAVLILLTALSLWGLILLHPDWGVINKHAGVRWLHKWAGKTTIVLAWLAVLQGFMKVQEDLLYRFLFVIPIVLIGIVILY